MKRINAKEPNIDGKLGDVAWCLASWCQEVCVATDMVGNVWVFDLDGWLRVGFIPQLTFEAAENFWNALAFAFIRTFLENEVTDGS